MSNYCPWDIFSKVRILTQSENYNQNFFETPNKTCSMVKVSHTSFPIGLEKWASSLKGKIKKTNGTSVKFFSKISNFFGCFEFWSRYYPELFFNEKFTLDPIYQNYNELRIGNRTCELGISVENIRSIVACHYLALLRCYSFFIGLLS